jgi:hypothetical protein
MLVMLLVTVMLNSRTLETVGTTLCRNVLAVSISKADWGDDENSEDQT